MTLDNDDLVILEIAVPRGWRDFLYAFPEWKNFDPDAYDSLTKELRSMVEAQVEMHLGGINMLHPDKAAEYAHRYGICDDCYPIAPAGEGAHV